MGSAAASSKFATANGAGSLAANAVVGHRRRRRLQDLHRLEDGMTRNGLANALEAVSFAGGHCLLSLDRGVRDYIVRLLRDR